MNKDRIDIGSKWVRENYGERFKFLQDKQCESSMLIKSDDNSKSINEVEECMMKEFKKQNKTNNVWVKQS